MKILHIVEEFGFREWYAVLSDERWEELREEWKTVKGLSCLVPVPFLIPEAVHPPILPEHEWLLGEDVEVFSAHIHEGDDSYLADVDHTIPEGDFEFKGVRYTKEQVSDLYAQCMDDQNKIGKIRQMEEPGYMDKMGGLPPQWIGLKKRLTRVWIRKDDLRNTDPKVHGGNEGNNNTEEEL